MKFFEGKVCRVCRKPASMRVRVGYPVEYLYYCRKCAEDCTMGDK